MRIPILSGIVLLFAAFILVETSVALEPRERKSPVKYRQYQNLEHQFSFLYPAPWISREPSRHAVVATFDLQTTDGRQARFALFEMEWEMGVIPSRTRSVERPLTLGGEEPLTETIETQCEGALTGVPQGCSVSYSFKNRTLSQRGLEAVLWIDLSGEDVGGGIGSTQGSFAERFLVERKLVRKLLSTFRSTAL